MNGVTITRAEHRRNKRRTFNKWFAFHCLKWIAIAELVVLLMYAMILGIGHAVQQHDNKVAAIRQGVIFDD